MALFPVVSLQSAGPIATIVNYIWPSALFLYWLMTDRHRKMKNIEVYKIRLVSYFWDSLFLMKGWQLSSASILFFAL